ncbi:MAG: hypothetical protein ACREMA_12245, partial [Longimicrobiales bacterium]
GNATVIASRVGTSPAYGAALLPGGELLVSEWNGNIWLVDSQGGIRRYARLDANIYQIATDAAGTVYAASYNGNILRWQPKRGVSTLETGFQKGRLVAIAASPDGLVYAAERGEGGRILRFDRDGTRGLLFHTPNALFYGLSVDQEFLYALDLRERRLLRLPVDKLSLLADR